MMVLEAVILVPVGLVYMAGILLLLVVARLDDRRRSSGRAWRLPLSIVALVGFGVVCSQSHLLWALFLMPLWYALMLIYLPVALFFGLAQ